MRERRLWPITLTVSECAKALHVHRREIYAGIRLDGLPLYRKGVRKFLLTADVVEWIRKTWKREFVK
jgi:excisionase family DNA binding protein